MVPCCGALGGLDLEAGLAVAGPPPGAFFGGFPRNHLDAVGDHEDAVEPDAELADQVGVAFGVSRQIGEEILRARARDGAQMLDQILVVHADSVVADGERMLHFVEIQIDARLECQGLVRILGQREVLELVERIGGIRHQLAQKNLRMRIEGVNNQVE